LLDPVTIAFLTGAATGVADHSIKGLKKLLNRFSNNRKHAKQLSLPDPTTQPPPVVNAVPFTVRLGDSPLLVVKSITHAWQLDVLFTQTGCSILYLPYEWSDSIIHRVATNDIDVAIYNYYRTVQYCMNNPYCQIFIACDNIGFSMGGDNIYLLAKNGSEPFLFSPDDFNNEVRGCTLALPMNSDVEESLYRLFNTSREILDRNNVKLVDLSSSPSLDIFRLNSDVLLTAGQNVRFQAIFRGGFKIIPASTLLDDRSQSQLKLHSRNCVIISPRLKDTLGTAKIMALINNSKQTFYNRWHSIEDSASLLNTLCDHFFSLCQSRDEAIFVIKSILFGTYRFGDPPDD